MDCPLMKDLRQKEVRFHIESKEQSQKLLTLILKDLSSAWNKIGKDDENRKELLENFSQRYCQLTKLVVSPSHIISEWMCKFDDLLKNSHGLKTPITVK